MIARLIDDGMGASRPWDGAAARAFEAQAIDYVLKPVQPERLRRIEEGARNG